MTSFLSPVFMTMWLVLMAATTSAKIQTRPKRCCSPKQFTAELKNTAVTYKYYSEMDQPESTLAYDYTNRRWALRAQRANDASKYSHFVYDHRNEFKMGIVDGVCQKTTLTGLMGEHCVTSNSSYDGYFHHGVGDKKFRVNQWSYPFGIFPTKSVRFVTNKGCYPIKDIAGVVTKNSFQYEKGNDPCIPWEEPRKVIKGKCYKSYKPQTVTKTTIDFSAPLIVADFHNLELGITKPEMFDVPKDCQEVTDEVWDTSYAKLENVDMWRSYKMRFNPHDPIGDDGIKL